MLTVIMYVIINHVVYHKNLYDAVVNLTCSSLNIMFVCVCVCVCVCMCWDGRNKMKGGTFS